MYYCPVALGFGIADDDRDSIPVSRLPVRLSYHKNRDEDSSGTNRV